MIDFNIVNFLTIGLISLLSSAAVRFILDKLGLRPAWL